jgi:hypothetical protein
MLVGYKTYIVSLIMIVTGVLAQTNWIDFLDNPKAGAVAIGSAILMAVLRSITTTPGAIQLIVNKQEDKK